MSDKVKRASRARASARLLINALEEFTDSAQYNKWSSERIIQELRKEIEDMRAEVGAQN